MPHRFSHFQSVISALGLFVLSASAQMPGIAVVRHAPAVSGAIEGSVHELLPEAVNLAGNASISGDLLVPGMPAVRLNGHPVFGGTMDGPGAASPSNYEIILNGSAQLGRLVR